MTVADDARVGEAGQAAPKQLSTLQFILIVTVLTVAAAAVGFLIGRQILSSARDPGGNSAVQHAGYLGERQRMESAKLRPLAPIVTNLADSTPVWIRLEASLVFQEIPEDADGLSARITEDIVGYLRTVSVKQIEGAAGFQYLSEDLNERARARSDGLVQEIIIQGLIVE